MGNTVLNNVVEWNAQILQFNKCSKQLFGGGFVSQVLSTT